MADITIAGLPVQTTNLAASDILHISVGGVNKQITASLIAQSISTLLGITAFGSSFIQSADAQAARDTLELNKAIVDWSSTTSYAVGNLAKDATTGAVYQSILAPNLNNALTDTNYWKIWDVTVSKLNFTPKTATISSGAITVSGSSYIIVDTEGGAATDDLDTINGGNDGDILILRSTDNARNITIKHLGGNIRTDTQEDITLDLSSD
jgi:hypothetical protein